MTKEHQNHGPTTAKQPQAPSTSKSTSTLLSKTSKVYAPVDSRTRSIQYLFLLNKYIYQTKHNENIQNNEIKVETATLAVTKEHENPGPTPKKQQHAASTTARRPKSASSSQSATTRNGSKDVKVADITTDQHAFRASARINAKSSSSAEKSTNKKKANGAAEKAVSAVKALADRAVKQPTPTTAKISSIGSASRKLNVIAQVTSKSLGAYSLRNDHDGQKSGRRLNVELADDTGRIGAVFFDDKTFAYKEQQINHFFEQLKVGKV